MIAQELERSSPDRVRFPHLGCKTCVMTWGITAGQPDLIFEQEKLLDRSHTFLQRVRRRLHARRYGRKKA